MSFDPIAQTAWLTARVRATETTRATPLFRDPFASRLVSDPRAPAADTWGTLAGSDPESPEALRALFETDPDRASLGMRTASLAVRMRYFDDWVLERVRLGARKIVLVAAGLDTRVYRLPLPSGLRWIEVDRPATLAFKRELLRGETPHAELLDIGGDLRDPTVLAQLGEALLPTRGAPEGPSCWLLEGLLPYLDAQEVDTLLDTVVGTQSAQAQFLGSGSALAFDVPNRACADPQGMLAKHVARLAANGSPWKFSTDAPASLLELRGLRARVEHIGSPAAHYGRLPFPATEHVLPGMPTSFLVTGDRA